MLINLARIGKNGSGMWQYSASFVECMNRAGLLDAIICEKSHKHAFAKYDCPLIFTPWWVSNTARVSKIRPILWLLYSYYLVSKIRFKYPGKAILSTTHHSLPLLKNQVITVHDLRPYYSPDSFLQKFYFRKILPRAIHRCHKVITVSKTVKNQICDIMSYPKQKVFVVPNAININDFQSPPKNCLQPYFLAVGASWTHKNIHSFMMNSDLWKDLGRLIVVCGKTTYFEELRVIAESEGIMEDVEFIHDVSFIELKSLYVNSYALIYPSTDEGFGIPPIEAMASGTAVIVNDIPVFREVLGESAIYVNSESRSSWESALSILEAKRNEYIEKGLCTAKKYSIDNMQDAVKKVFSRLED